MGGEIPFGSSEYDDADALTHMPFIDQYWQDLQVSRRTVREAALPIAILQYHVALLRIALKYGSEMPELQGDVEK